MNRVELEGHGLFGGAICRVVLTRTDLDHVRVSAGGSAFVRADELRVVSTLRTTTVGCDAMKLGLVEHLFAALAGLRVRAGLDIEASGNELPLLDGGASAWCAALGELGLDEVGPRLRVREAGDVTVGESVYRFSMSRDISITVGVDFGDARIARDAHWGGDSADFVERIAPARTFARVADTEAMLAAGLGAHVDPRSVIVLADTQIHATGRAFEPDEPARHKLLDLLGDLYVHGGPPVGSLDAWRPGHAATHRAVEVALERGLLSAW